MDVISAAMRSSSASIAATAPSASALRSAIELAPQARAASVALVSASSSCAASARGRRAAVSPVKGSSMTNSDMGAV